MFDSHHVRGNFVRRLYNVISNSYTYHVPNAIIALHRKAEPAYLSNKSPSRRCWLAA
jgi:hypothetical protein